MAVSATPYGKFLLGLGLSQFNFSTDTIKGALHTSAYVPNVDTHQFYSQVTNETSGTGYDAGGKTFTGVTWTHDTVNHRAVLSANQLLWAGASFTARYLVVFKWTGDATTSRLIGWIDFGTEKTLDAEDFQMSFPNGLVRIRGI